MSIRDSGRTGLLNRDNHAVFGSFRRKISAETDKVICNSDVYKRQSATLGEGTRITGLCKRQNSEREPAPAREMTRSAAAYAAAISLMKSVTYKFGVSPAAFTAVSYTHLDVYKRQILHWIMLLLIK